MGDEESNRRGRGVLEADVKTITDRFASGELTLDEGQALTPHRIGRLIKEQDGIDDVPSTGAIVNVLRRWETIGFAAVNDKPLAFLDYTDTGRAQGLTALKAAGKEARSAERKAAKAVSTAAAPAAAV